MDLTLLKSVRYPASSIPSVPGTGQQLLRRGDPKALAGRRVG
ncbi:MAG: hypothetical protein ACI9R3_000424 [Verrucomicrobiales bacterium]|jgi:hypothetical protein